MKIIIAGSRSISSIELVRRAVALSGFTITEVVTGCAVGIDTDAIDYAHEIGVPYKPFEVTKAHWRRNPFNAGFLRNRDMADYADGVVAVWDGKSGGTLDMVALMRQAGKLHYLFDVRKHGNSASLLDFA